MTHYGIDISSNNPHPIDYPAVVADLRNRGEGAQPFVIVKATQGTGYVNPFFAEDVAGFRQAGAAVAAYLMDEGNQDPAAEEQVFRRVAGPLPQWDDDELPDGNAAYAQHCAALVAQNPQAGDYLNQSEEDAGFPAGAGIWEANYNRTPGVTHKPGVLIHQFDDAGTVAGISGPVDLDVWLGTEDRFETMFAGTVRAAVNVPADPAPYQVGDKMIHTINVETDSSGNGWAETSIPWTAFQSATPQGPYPPVDGYRPIPRVAAQDRDNSVCVTVEGAPANGFVTVFILASS